MVESTALEMRRAGNGTVGSNPTLSAIIRAQRAMMAERAAESAHRVRAEAAAGRGDDRPGLDPGEVNPTLYDPTPTSRIGTKFAPAAFTVSKAAEG